MTNRCFSSSQLYALRNQINVQMLIEKTLRIPCRVTQGCFRFLCPLCSGFDTAVNPKTNVARCFRCEKNFNTIDLSMLARQTDFVRSVKFLQSIHQKDDVSQDGGAPMTISGSNPQGDSRIRPKTLSADSDSDPCQIGEILCSILPIEQNGIPEKPLSQYKQNKAVTADQTAAEDRIVKLELQLEYLGRQIRKLSQTINAALPSK